MKTLSAANQANIEHGTGHVIKVDLTNQSKFWSYGEAAGYDPIIDSIDAISQTIDAYGGLGSYGDVSFTIHKEYGTNQIIQTDALDNEPVVISVAYGSDADIVIWKGRVDSWEYSAGLLTINCITRLSIKGETLPLQQINATNYSTFIIPGDQVGRWVPFTIGTPYRPACLQAAYGGDVGSKYVANAPVTGHDAIGVYASGFPRFYYWNGNAGRWINETNSTGVDGEDLTAGYIAIRVTSNGWTRDVQPIDAAWTLDGSTTPGAGTDEEKAINADTSDFALLDNPAPDATTTGGQWTGTIPDLPFGGGHEVTSMYFSGKVTKEQGLNHGARVSEVFEFGIEVIPGTAPDADQMQDILTAAETAFNNVDGGDGDTDLALNVANYNDILGQDALNNNSPTFLIDKLSGLILYINCIEEDLAAGGDESDYFRIYAAGLHILVNVGHFQYKTVYGELSGYDDDGSGTYTGSASSLIETPVDVIYFILGEIFGQTGFDSTSITTARTAFGAYIIGGQFTTVIDAEPALSEILDNSRMSVIVDYKDEWFFKYWELPAATPDKTFSQNLAHFAQEEIVSVTQSASENLYNQFELLYGWNIAERRFNDVLLLNESTAGAIGTWLTSSQADHNITRKLTVEAKWINDDDTATSYGNYLIYRYADRKRVVTFKTGFNGLDIELLDRVQLTHQDLTDTDESGGGGHDYEITDIETDLASGIITFTGFQADVPNAALTDPT